jgi:hypothetical protein
MRDEVDELVEAWARERPDLDLAPVEVYSVRAVKHHGAPLSPWVRRARIRPA